MMEKIDQVARAFFHLRRWLVFFEDLFQRSLLSHLVQVEVEDVQERRVLLEAPPVGLEVVFGLDGHNFAIRVLLVCAKMVKMLLMASTL